MNKRKSSLCVRPEGPKARKTPVQLFVFSGFLLSVPITSLGSRASPDHCFFRLHSQISRLIPGIARVRNNLAVRRCIRQRVQSVPSSEEMTSGANLTGRSIRCSPTAIAAAAPLLPPCGPSENPVQQGKGVHGFFSGREQGYAPSIEYHWSSMVQALPRFAPRANSQVSANPDHHGRCV